MPSLNIFVSFEFDKDNDLKNNFYEQAKEQTPHRVRNCSLHESYPDDEWKRKAREAIEVCDVVVLLVGEDTHNAPGVIVETGHSSQLGQADYSDQASAEGLPRVDPSWKPDQGDVEEHQCRTKPFAHTGAVSIAEGYMRRLRWPRI